MTSGGRALGPDCSDWDSRPTGREVAIEILVVLALDKGAWFETVMRLDLVYALYNHGWNWGALLADLVAGP